MKRLLIALCLLNLIILIMDLIQFIALDKKLDWAIEKQGKLNEGTYESIKNHEQMIRILETDNQIFMNILTSHEYCNIEEE